MEFDVGKPIAEDVGSAMRRARLARGLTLREVGTKSRGVLTPTAVAGYERGERGISLQRFCDLATFYGIPPEQLLAEILHGVPTRAELIDLTELEERQPHDA